MTRCSWCGDDGALGIPEVCSACGYSAGADPGWGPDAGEWTLQLVAIAGIDVQTGHEGRWVVDLEPEAGEPVTTDDRAEALKFRDTSAARRYWMRWDGRIRPDGRPSRPLTAWSIQINRGAG